MKLLIYCTKNKKQLYYDVISQKYMYGLNGGKDKFNSLNGKVVAECDFEIEPIDELGICPSMYQEELLSLSCLTEEQLMQYLNGKGGYAIHIKNLKKYEKPKELSDYMPICKGLYDAQEYHNFFFGSQDEFAPQVKKAPQNMMYVSSNGFDKLCLISIRPEWVCKILNGEKTIEVRKKILNCMKETIR